MDGVLGGYGHVDEADIVGSEVFLNTLISERFPNASGAADQEHLVALGTHSLSLSCCCYVRFFFLVYSSEGMAIKVCF